MSYSRWTNSTWYTFWCTSDSEIRDEQLFAICGIRQFTYGELKENGLGCCIESLKETIKEQNKNKDKKENMFGGGEYSDENFEELKEYMKEFMKEVEEVYNTPSQLYRDGEITLEQAFVEEI